MAFLKGNPILIEITVQKQSVQTHVLNSCHVTWSELPHVVASDSLMCWGLLDGNAFQHYTSQVI